MGETTTTGRGGVRRVVMGLHTSYAEANRVADGVFGKPHPDWPGWTCEETVIEREFYPRPPDAPVFRVVGVYRRPVRRP